MNTIVLDMGGVLARDAVGPKLQDLATRYEIPVAALRATARELRPQVDLGSLSETDFWTHVLRTHGIEPSPSDLELRSYASPLDGAQEFLAWAHNVGFALAVLSNDSTELYRLREAALGSAARFRAVVVSAAIGMVKPDPRVYRSVVTALGVTPGECLFVDDRQANVAGAQAIGMHALRFRGFGEVRSVALTDSSSAGLPTASPSSASPAS